LLDFMVSEPTPHWIRVEYFLIGSESRSANSIP
jgi:hypothetical protein